MRLTESHQESRMKAFSTSFVRLDYVCLLAAPISTAKQPSPDRDNAIVQALLRIPDAKIEAYPQHADAIKRYLKSVSGTTQYLLVVGQFERVARAVSQGIGPVTCG